MCIKQEHTQKGESRVKRTFIIASHFFCWLCVPEMCFSSEYYLSTSFILFGAHYETVANAPIDGL